MPQVRRLKSVMVSAWACDSFSWFQSAIVFTKNEFLNCSVCGYSSGVVGC